MMELAGMRMLMVERAPQFSPNSVDKDRAILTALAERLAKRGCAVSFINEQALKHSPKSYEFIFTMSRLPETLKSLADFRGRIINRPEAIARCSRCELEQVMTYADVPQPPREGPDGYWLKRGDQAAQSQGDVVFAPDQAALTDAIAAMRQRGIERFTIRAHVRGDLVKFYGVAGAGFFRYYYPTDDGETKYGDEQRNGKAHHYSFDAACLQTCAERLAMTVGIEVYGGDCIVRTDGSFCVIDFNDWPSFSRCREEAADAIVRLIEK